MKKKKDQKAPVRGCLIKTILLMYLLSALLLVLLAYIVSQVQQPEPVARWGVVVIYILSGLAGGFALGKWKKQKKFLWGMTAGFLYTAILFGIASVMGAGSLPALDYFASVLGICLFSGMLGGMLS
jgi:putative membrane protein (TIGR04086 family)